MAEGAQRPLLMATAAALFSACPAAAQDSFHVTFGTTGEPESRYADGAGFVVETDSGDIVVAGSGESYFSDDGIGVRTYPLIARFNSRGELEWQRVYNDLEDHRFTAVLSAGEEQYVMLREDAAFNGRDAVPRPISLRRVDAVGDVSESLGELGGYEVLRAFPVAGVEPHFLVVAARHAAGGGPALDVKLFRFDLRNVTEQGSPAGIGSLVDLQDAGGGELLFSRWRLREPAEFRGRGTIESEIVRMRETGETEVVATVPEKLCRSVASSLNRVFCVAYAPPGPDEPDVLVAYSTAGQELWRRVLEPGVRVQRMRVLEAGELVYSYARDMDAVVNRLSASGDLVWTRRLRSTGPYTYLAGIEPLRGGRLALFGLTGPFGAFTSTDTNAMLVVTGVADGDVRAEIVSIVVGSP